MQSHSGELKHLIIRYIHTEPNAKTELKHGPLALISPTTPTVFVLPDDDLLEKNLSTIEEIRARKGPCSWSPMSRVII